MHRIEFITFHWEYLLLFLIYFFLSIFCSFFFRSFDKYRNSTRKCNELYCHWNHFDWRETMVKIIYCWHLLQSSIKNGDKKLHANCIGWSFRWSQLMSFYHLVKQFQIFLFLTIIKTKQQQIITKKKIRIYLNLTNK